MPDPSEIRSDAALSPLQTAARLLAEGKAEEAVAGLEALVEEAPAYSLAHVLLAKSYEATARWEDALGAWHRAHVLVPTSPFVQRERRRILDALTPQPTREQHPVRAEGVLSGRTRVEDERYEDRVAESMERSRQPGEFEGDLDIDSDTSVREAQPGDLVSEAAVSKHEPSVEESEDPAILDSAASHEGAATDLSDQTTVDQEANEWDDRSARQAEVENDEDAPGSLSDELDSLIQQLEDAPRIRPDPSFEVPEVEIDDEVEEDMVSETLARIYAAQKQYAEAAIVYEKLAQQKPEEAIEHLQRAAEMRAQGRG